MQGNGQDGSTPSASVSPTQIDFVKFLQKCASSPHPIKKYASASSNHGDGSAFTSPELLADTLLNWDAGARLAGFDSSETPSWPALRVQLQQQGFPHDSLPHHMSYSSHADACVRGVLGDVLLQYGLRGQLVQQLIDTVEFASMHDSHSIIVNGSNASAAHELSRALETNQFRNFEEAAVQRATEQSLRQQLRQAETDLQSCKERNRQLRSQASDLEEEVHLMTRQLTKLRGGSTPAAAVSGNGRWQPPQEPLFKLPSAASSPAYPAPATGNTQDLRALITENDALKESLAAAHVLYEELRQSTGGGEQAGAAAALPVKSADAAVETEGSSKLFSEEMFRIFNVSNYSACCRVARATLQLANTVPRLQAFAADVSEACRQCSPDAVLESTEDTIRALRAVCSRFSELGAGRSGALELRRGVAVVSVPHSHVDAASADRWDSSKAAGHLEAFDGSNLVCFTGPHSEDSLATSPLPQPRAPALAAHTAHQGDAARAAVAEAMALVGCSRPEELLMCVEHLLVQSDELQHLRAVLSRRLELADPCATFVDAELSSRQAQHDVAAGEHGRSTGIMLRDPDEALLPHPANSGDRQQQQHQQEPDGCAVSARQSLAWDIIMHPARRTKPKLTSKAISLHSLHAQHNQPRDMHPSRAASSQRKQQSSQHATAGFSKQLFANFKRRLLSQNSAAAVELFAASGRQHGSHRAL
jgi:hypothetical protein